MQLCEHALNSLRFFSGSGWRVAATGSQLGVDAKKRKLPFPSGVEQLTMHPMTFGEFLQALGEGQMAEAIATHAKNMQSFMEKAHSPFAIVFSENNFSQSMAENGAPLLHVPLYAAHCLGNTYLEDIDISQWVVDSGA